MRNSLLSSISLMHPSGIVILVAILALLGGGIAITMWVRARYALIARDLRRGRDNADFGSRLVRRAVQGTQDALATGATEVNTQAIVESAFQAELGGLLVAERFVKSATGLSIIMGLIGTFYGLSSSIGRLSALLSGESPNAAEATAALSQGLTETLSGMSVAFVSSLFGIVSAVLLTLLGVFFNIADRRLALMVQIESYLDNTYVAAALATLGVSGARVAGGGAALHGDARVERMLAGFGESVSRLNGAVASFESALSGFASSTRAPVPVAWRARSAASTSSISRAGRECGSSMRTCSPSARCAAYRTRTWCCRRRATATKPGWTRSVPVLRSRSEWNAPNGG